MRPRAGGLLLHDWQGGVICETRTRRSSPVIMIRWSFDDASSWAARWLYASRATARQRWRISQVRCAPLARPSGCRARMPRKHTQNAELTFSRIYQHVADFVVSAPIWPPDDPDGRPRWSPHPGLGSFGSGACGTRQMRHFHDRLKACTSGSHVHGRSAGMCRPCRTSH